MIPAALQKFTALMHECAYGARGGIAASGDLCEAGSETPPITGLSSR
jgi:hypothetical protein